MAVLSEQLDRTRSGFGTVVLVEGDAGMGKSRILEEVQRVARERQFRVASTAADPTDSMVELSTLMTALFDGPDPILDRNALPDSHSLPEQRYWLIHDLQGLLELGARQRPLLVCLDDLQWADGGTAAALRALPVRLATKPIAWVLAFRPSIRSGQFAKVLEYLEQNGAETIDLYSLSESAVREVTASALQAEPGSDVLRIAESAGGNPFFLNEILGGLKEERLIRIDRGQAELLETRLPDSVGESVRRRLEHLSDLAHQVAAVATALGRSFSFDELAAMLDLPPSALLAPVKEVLQAGLFLESGQKLTFRHDIILEAVRANLPSSVGRSLDRQAATVLIANGALPLEVATRLSASADHGDEVAIATLGKAADTLDMSDPGAAADISQQALNLMPRNHSLRRTLVAQTAIRLHAAGRIDAATAFADTVLRQALPPDEEAGFRLIIATMFATSPDVCADSCQKGLALPEVSPFLRMLFLANLFHNLAHAGRLDEARKVLPEARRAVEETNEPCGYFVLGLAESGLHYAEGQFARALELVKTAAGYGEVCAGDPDLSPQHVKIMQGRRFLVTQWLCDTLTAVDRFDEAELISLQNITIAERERQAWALNIYETGRGRQLLQTGNLSEAAAALRERLTADRSYDVLTVLDAAGVVALGRIAIHTGDRQLMRQANEIAHVMLDRGPPSVQRHAVWLLALHAMADGDPVMAHQWLCTLGQEERRSILPRFPMDVSDEADLVRMALAADDNELAEHAASSAVRRSELNPGVPTLQAVAAITTGLIGRSQEDLAVAVKFYKEGPRSLALASALEDLGLLAVESGEKQEGIEGFSEALKLYTRAGAIWDASRVR
ncbi:MAG: AAA family ATPase, partial [Acidimicrobiales bacterium]